MRKLFSVSSVVLVGAIVSALSLTFATAAHASDAAQRIPANAQFNIENYAGKVVYVDFWASWCAPCRHSFPFMNELHEQFADELAVVAINVDEYRENAQVFLEAFNPRFNIVYDPEGELASGFDLPGMPTSYLFDRKGNLITRHIGFKQSQIEALRKMVADAVRGSTVLADND